MLNGSGLFWKATLCAGLAFASLFGYVSSQQPTQAVASSSASATASPSPTPSASATTNCASGWAMVEDPHEQGRLLSKGVPQEGSAKKTFLNWLELIKPDAVVLAGAVKVFTHQTVDPASLDQSGCASQAAQIDYVQIKLALEGATSITQTVAPASGYNSSVQNGAFEPASTAGITGNRKAILATLSSGEQIWVMYRCGNLVTPGPVQQPVSQPIPGASPTPVYVPPVYVPPTKVVPPPSHTTPPTPTCSAGTVWDSGINRCITSKNSAVSVKQPPSTISDTADARQPTPPTSGTGTSGSAGTNGSPGHTGSNGGTGTGDHGTSVPVQGANTSSNNSNAGANESANTPSGASTSNTTAGNTNNGDPGGM